MRTAFLLALALGVSVPVVAAHSAPKNPMPTIDTQPWGEADGSPVSLFTLTNSNGMVVKITNYGGRVTSIMVPDKDGNMGDVVLGFDSLEGYKADNPYFGALIGRYGNRIGGAQFELDGQTYHLDANENGNTLHGGAKGFDKRVWNAKALKPKKDSVGLELSYLSKDGEMGFPGDLIATVVYTLTNDNELKIDYKANTDKDTVVNLTNHAYFALCGQGNGSIEDETLTIHADAFTPVNARLIPTGEIRPVKGTPFDFRDAMVIGDRINADNEQLKFAGGYDHNWVLTGGSTKEPRKVATVEDPKTGRVLEVYTVEPGIQFYAGNFLDGSLTGKDGQVYKHRYALCLETQHFPDSPNKPGFPSTKLAPAHTYRTETIYKFTVAK